METSLEIKKAFALAQIAPYFKDPSTCGIDGRTCLYETSDGRMCVLGKNLLPEARKHAGGNARIVLDKYESQSECLIPEAVDILTTDEWRMLQSIHDSIARQYKFNSKLDDLRLFTLDELKEYVDKI